MKTEEEQVRPTECHWCERRPMARRRDLASLEYVDAMAFHPKAVGAVHLAVPALED